MNTTPSILCCPICKFPLEKNANNLICKEHGEYVIKKGFPSFCDYNEFDNHWNDNFTEEIPEPKKLAAKNFLDSIDFTNLDEGKTILDIGCGDGMHVNYINNLPIKKFSNLWAIDISLSALLSCKKRDKKSWNLAHADAINLPFLSSSFDISYSYGVICYSSNPKKAFSEMARITKPGGIVGLWVYPKATGIGGFAFNTIRSFCRLTGSIGTHILANLIVPFIGFLPTTSKVNLTNSTWKQCREIVLVNIAPTNLYFPTEEEVKGWFKEEGLDIYLNKENEPITIWAKKPNSDIVG